MTGIPKIRFEGFTAAWEERTIKEIAPLQRGFDLPSVKMESGSYPVVMSNGIGGYHAEFKVRGPGVVTGRSGTIGKLHYIEDNYWPHNTSLWVTDFNGNYPKFIYYLYQELDLSRFGTGSSVPTLNRNDVHDTFVKIPQENEQKKIAEYFSCLDSLAILHQCKCDELKELKKYMLQKMFPKNDKKIPEIRFKGFTGDWEQCKLKEISEKVTEKNRNIGYNEPFTNSAEMGIISQKDYFDREVVNEENLDNYYVVRNDDFVYNPRISVTAPVGPINRNRLGRSGVMSPLYTVFRTHDINILYLEHYFKSARWHRFMKLNGDSGARFDRFTIATAQFMEMPIPCPVPEEQMKIGLYFENLDHLITHHQHRCDALHETKKYMLQNMFPQKG